MKNLTWLAALAAILALPIASGCGGGETTVIEAPEASEVDESAMPGMTDEEYDAAMEADMNG